MIESHADVVRFPEAGQPATRSADNELRVRLDTASLKMERQYLGSVPRARAGINALALLMSERHPGAIKCVLLGSVYTFLRSVTLTQAV